MKSLFSKYKGIIKKNILLVAVWGTVIVTGFLALGAIVSDLDSLLIFSGVHRMTVRLGLAYTAIHIFRHRKQIMLRFGVKIDSSKQAENERLKNSRAVKIISAIGFHILLHMVSIHLAVATALFHIVQHRHGILLPFKKLLLRNNAALNRSLQAARMIPSMQAVPLAA